MERSFCCSSRIVHRGAGSLAVLDVGVRAVGLLRHVIDSQGEDREPIDDAARRLRIPFGVRACRGAPRLKLPNQVVIEHLDVVVSLLVQAVDVPLDFGNGRVAGVRAAGDILLVPEKVVLLVLAANEVQQARPVVRIVHLSMVPTLHGGSMQFGDGSNVDHGSLPMLVSLPVKPTPIHSRRPQGFLRRRLGRAANRAGNAARS